jgi:threonine dehydrogenase-like Zn-dependent dehydrogenase
LGPRGHAGWACWWLFEQMSLGFLLDLISFRVAAADSRADKGDTVAVVGDGAVGLSAVLASKRLGAERIIAPSRNPVRQQVALEFGAPDILAERGDDAALECVGTGQSMATALAIARPRSTVGVVGAPHGADVPFESNFWRSVGWQGGVAPARVYIPRAAR